MVEKFLCPLCTKLGWRSDLALQDLVPTPAWRWINRFKLDSIDLWETVVISNNKSSLARRVAQGSSSRGFDGGAVGEEAGATAGSHHQEVRPELPASRAVELIDDRSSLQQLRPGLEADQTSAGQSEFCPACGALKRCSSARPG